MPTEPFFHIAPPPSLLRPTARDTDARHHRHEETKAAPPSLSKDGAKGGTASNRDCGETDGKIGQGSEKDC